MRLIVLCGELNIETTLSYFQSSKLVIALKFAYLDSIKRQQA